MKKLVALCLACMLALLCAGGLAEVSKDGLPVSFVDINCESGLPGVCGNGSLDCAGGREICIPRIRPGARKWMSASTPPSGPPRPSIFLRW